MDKFSSMYHHYPSIIGCHIPDPGYNRVNSSLLYGTLELLLCNTMYNDSHESDT